VPRCSGSSCGGDVDAGRGVGGGDDAGGSVMDPPLPGVLPPGECTVTPSVSAFDNPHKELQWQGAGHAFPTYEHVVTSPVVVDFIEDGPDDLVPEILFITYDSSASNAVLRVVSGREPHDMIMTLAGDGTGPVTDDAMAAMATPSLQWDGHPAAGDLTGDGRAEVVALLQAGGAVAFRSDGSELWRSAIPAAEHHPNGSLAIADLDHDGTPEVIVGRVVIDGQTGVVRWTGTGGKGVNGQGPLSCVADVVPGGSMEVVAGNTVYDSHGAVVWTAPASTGDGFCAVADIVDASGMPGRDGTPEVIRVGGGKLTMLDGQTGAMRWQRALPGCTGTGGAPTVADFDGDGHMEVGVAGSSCLAVIDPDCDVSPVPAGCQARGVLWTATSEDTSSAVTSSTVFDFNGDGRAEVIYNDEEYFRVFDGVTGMVLFEDPIPSRTRTEQPIVADVDNDGNAEIVFGGNHETGFAGDTLAPADRVPGLEVWGSGDDAWVGARPIWNEHTYHIDNVGVHGEIPRDEAPSWATHDSYRQNLASENVLAAPDLLSTALDADYSRCGDDVLRVCAYVRNMGDTRVGEGLEVGFYDGDPDAGGTLIGMAHTLHGLVPRAGGENVCVDWVGAPTTTPRPVFVKVDPSGTARECVETNNVTPLGDQACPTFG